MTVINANSTVGLQVNWVRLVCLGAVLDVLCLKLKQDNPFSSSSQVIDIMHQYYLFASDTLGEGGSLHRIV